MSTCIGHLIKGALDEVYALEMSLLSSLIPSRYSLYCFVGFTVIIAVLPARIIANAKKIFPPSCPVVHSTSTMEKDIAPEPQNDMAVTDSTDAFAPAIETFKVSFCDAFDEPLCEYLTSSIKPPSKRRSRRRGSLSITETPKSPILSTLRTLPTFIRRKSRVEPNAIDSEQQ